MEFKFGKPDADLLESSTGLLSIKTSDYGKVKDRPEETGKEIFNEAGVRILYMGISESTEGYDFEADIFIENTNDKPINCMIGGGTVDGIEEYASGEAHVSVIRVTIR